MEWDRSWPLFASAALIASIALLICCGVLLCSCGVLPRHWLTMKRVQPRTQQRRASHRQQVAPNQRPMRQVPTYDSLPSPSSDGSCSSLSKHQPRDGGHDSSIGYDHGLQLALPLDSARSSAIDYDHSDSMTGESFAAPSSRSAPAKLSQLRANAVKMGVGNAALEAALDEDDPKAADIDLFVSPTDQASTSGQQPAAAASSGHTPASQNGALVWPVAPHTSSPCKVDGSSSTSIDDLQNMYERLEEQQRAIAKLQIELADPM